MPTPDEAGPLASQVPRGRAGKDLSPNMRAIHLTMRIAELQLARGVGARDVVEQALHITETHCERRVWFDVVASVVLASQDRGSEREPLTLIRTVAAVPQNNMLVQRLQDLVREIVAGLPLDEAESRLESILGNQPAYPRWVQTLGNAGVGAGYVLLFSTSWVVVLATFVIGILVDVMTRALSSRATPPFFVQALASAAITLYAVGLGELGSRGVWPFVALSPTLIVVGGVVGLVAGLTIYATAADAIDEFFITAGARFFKTFMMTAGIVAGILGALILTHRLGSSVVFAPDAVPLGVIPVTVLGAVATAVAWAVYTQGSRSAVLWAGVIGGLGWLAYLATMSAGDVAAKGIAAFVVGLAASLVTRVGKTPSIAVVDAALVPLVPGLALLMGLLQFTRSPSPEGLFAGSVLLLTALGVALAIAAGAALGTFVGGPVRTQLVRARSFMPLGGTPRGTASTGHRPVPPGAPGEPRS